MTAFAPVRAEERISSLDTLRGFALLGILLMNIVGFGLHNAYENPLVAGGAEGWNLAAWITMHILAEGKMRCLFSMVFGAGVVLLTGRAEDRGAGSQVADIFLRRNLWLMLFGAFHAYLLWQGEILYPYGLCALALYPFRKLQARTLIILGAVLVIGSAAGNLVTGYVAMDTLSKGAAAEQLAKSGVKLTPEQEEIRKKREEMLKEDRPSPEEVEKANKQGRGSLWEVLKIRGKIVWRWHNLAYYHILHLDLFSMMFLGMGFYKLGIFSAARSPKFYVLLALAGYALGVTVNSFTAWTIVKSNWDLPTRLFCFTVYDVGRLSIALAHLGVLMLLCQKGWFGFVLRPLTAIGQTALSNYVFHSVVCATLFTGVGFGLFGTLQRYELYFVVLTIWAVQMVISPIWLKHYRFGPLEWGWRSLTYWQKQPMKI
jgi:uncharacterized protein